MQNLRNCLVFIFLLADFAGKAQCDCKSIPQNDSSIYLYCQPVYTAADSISKIQIGISGFGIDRFIHVSLAFNSDPQYFNSGLGIITEDDSSWICVLVQRQLKDIDGIPTANGLFSITPEELNRLRTKRIKSVTFYLEDGNMHTLNVEMISDNLSMQIDCINK